MNPINRIAKSPKIQWVRHTVRVLVLLFVILTPILTNYRRSAGQLHDPPQIRGNTWSAQIGPVSMTDPLAGAESIAASGNLSLTLMLSLLIPVGATLLLGRFFCAWICPAGLLFDLGDRFRNLLGRWDVPTKRVSLWRGNKYALLGAGLLVSAVLGIPVLGYFYPPASIGREAQNAALTAGGLFVFAVLCFEIFVAPRAWCRSFCPGGALYTLLGAFRVVKVKNDRLQCTSCQDCVKICPMGLHPLRDSLEMAECDQCLLCVEHCEPRSLSVEFSLPKVKPRSAP